MKKDAVANIAYLLGIPSDLLAREYPDFDEEKIHGIKDAERIRVYNRFRQIILRRNKTNDRSTPFSLRQFCSPELYDEIDKLIYGCNSIPEAINKVGNVIDASIVEILKACKVPYPDEIAGIIFHWQVQTKKTLDVLCAQFKNPKYNYPYDIFIPKPQSFERNLRYLLTNDESLYNAHPIAFSIAKRASSDISLPPPNELHEPSAVQSEAETNIWVRAGAIYCADRFSPIEAIGTKNSCISYIDFDNIPVYLTASVCNVASDSHKVKLFYDANSFSHIKHFENMPFVELIQVVRLSATKSLVDNKINTQIIIDAFKGDAQHIFLYSGDSDFCVLSETVLDMGIDFTVISVEQSIKQNYVELLHSHGATIYVLSQQAVIPTLSAAVVEKQLLGILSSTRIRDITLDYLTEAVLETMGGEEYRTFLQNDLEKIITKLMSKIQISWKNGLFSLVLQEA